MTLAVLGISAVGKNIILNVSRQTSKHGRAVKGERGKSRLKAAPNKSLVPPAAGTRIYSIILHILIYRTGGKITHYRIKKIKTRTHTHTQSRLVSGGTTDPGSDRTVQVSEAGLSWD